MKESGDGAKLKEAPKNKRPSCVQKARQKTPDATNTSTPSDGDEFCDDEELELDKRLVRGIL